MPKLKGIEYIVDEKGRKKSVIMSYKAFVELMEDVEDLKVINERRNESSFDLESVVEELKSARKL